MTSILFLDDDYERWNVFFRRFQFLDIKWVKTADECIEALEQRHWDIVSLDHDLGKLAGDGMEVVNYIVESLPSISVISIHSWNQPAASLMHETLWDTHQWEGNIYREVFGTKYLNDIATIISQLL